MKKLFALLLVIPFLLLASCEVDPEDNNVTPSETVKTPADFPVWNEWLEYKYGKEFGWDSGNHSALKAPITHDMSAEEFIFAKGLNAGYNLGNTHEGGSNPRASGGHYDKLMAGIKACGFNVIRIPCSWGGNTTAGTVNSGFLDEVEAAVTAAHAAGLYVFINSHHDKSYFSLDSAGVSYKNEGETGTNFVLYLERFQTVWTQIATRFKDYGDWLFFEPINEPTIMVSGATSWDGAPPEYHEVLNRWCQAFVDVVRDSGGNNEKRYLLFKSYAAKIQGALDPSNGFRVPEDPTGTGKLIYSFHSYVPQPLALEGQNYTWTSTFYTVFTSPFSQASEAFIKKGIPVFMGETGATFHSQRTGTESRDANRNRLLCLNALGHEARKYGVLPCLWDNGEATRSGSSGNPNGETFALVRRKAAHDDDYNNWGKPIDHTRLNGGSGTASTGGSAMAAGNAAADDPTFGVKTIDAFIDAINGRTVLWKNQAGMPEGLYP